MKTADKPKTIHTIDINLVELTPRVTRRQWLDESVADHLNCVLCGSTLEFKHDISYVEQSVNEQANCPTCRVRGRQANHTLQ